MAIFHLNAKVISRGKGQSAIAAAAYRSGERLKDEQTNEQKFYSARAERIEFTAIMAPKDAPAWAFDRNRLWNEAERAEKRKDAQLAREIEIALPHELTDEQRIFLVKDFAREAFVRKGYAVDIAIHAPDADSDMRNYHAHIMVTRRTLGADGFSAKKDWQFDPKQLEGWREQWANLANRHLERHGHDARVDHRSLDAQGIDREATVHVGYAGVEMTARGAQSDRMDALRDVLARNDIKIEIKAMEGELASLRAAQHHSTPRYGVRMVDQAGEDAALAMRQERRETKFKADQEVWRVSVEKRNPDKIKPAATTLEVVDSATGAVSKLGDFVMNLLAGPKPAPQNAKPDMKAFVSDPEARKSYQLAQLKASREMSEADKALDRIRVEWEAGRRLKAEDIAALTHEHQTAIFNRGDDAVRQMVEDARKRAEKYWKSDGRERER